MRRCEFGEHCSVNGSDARLCSSGALRGILSATEPIPEFDEGIKTEHVQIESDKAKSTLMLNQGSSINMNDEIMEKFIKEHPNDPELGSPLKMKDNMSVSEIIKFNNKMLKVIEYNNKY